MEEQPSLIILTADGGNGGQFTSSTSATGGASAHGGDFITDSTSVPQYESGAGGDGVTAEDGESVSTQVVVVQVVVRKVGSVGLLLLTMDRGFSMVQMMMIIKPKTEEVEKDSLLNHLPQKVEMD